MVSQLQLDNPFLEGVNSFYLLDGSGPTTLVDTGVSTPETVAQFESVLGAQGVGVEDLDRILLTHWHTDHAGLTGDVQARTDATVYVHEADAGLAGQDDGVWTEMCDTFLAAFDEWGMTDDESATSIGYVDNRDEYWGPPAAVETVADGETFDVGDGRLRAVSVPGHTLGSVCYEFEDGHGVFTGDTLLPGYTPNIGGGEFREMPSLLDQYLSSLEFFFGSTYDAAWPGHRGVISDPDVRARTIIQHHWDRLSHVLAAVRSYDGLDVRTLADHLFGSLEELHVFIGCAEAAIHLDYLATNDLVRETSDGYETTPEADRRLDEEFERRLE